jgi:thiol-disulfide isomerase/thioredoxin
MKHTYDDEASTLGDSFLKISALFFVGILILAFTTSPVATGTKEGERAPKIDGAAYAGSGWSSFDFSDQFDTAWDGNVSGDWVMIEFMDTDCPYCVRSAETYGDASEVFRASNPEWNGAQVNFFASATQLDIQGHETSRNEIKAFRDKSTGEECDGQDCANRAGSAHDFVTYFDDIDQENMDEWDIRGTPTYFLIQPDGIIAWVSSGGTNVGDTNGDGDQNTFIDAIVKLVTRENGTNGGA